MSSAVNLFSDKDLEELLTISRRNNHARNVTGMLLYASGNFMQVLEGEEKDVVETHNRISRDRRHTGLLTLMQGERPAREFDAWSMGFKKLEAAEADPVRGYSDFMSDPLTSPTFTANPSKAITLLSFFKKNMR